MTAIRSVLIIGDSFVLGAGATGNFGWAQRVAKAFPELDVDIQGVAGDTVDKVHTRWPDKIYDLVILQVGTNDSCFRAYKNALETPPERFLKYLGKIHERLRPPVGSRLILVGPMFVEETQTVRFAPEKVYTQASIDAYDLLLRRFAKRHEVALISLQVIQRHGKMLSDGLHPSDRGHDAIAHRVGKHLRSILRADAGSSDAEEAKA